MVEIGDWVDALGGYGIVVSVVPEYYEYWYTNVPPGKSVGDKKQDIVVVKKLCNHEFKVGIQTKCLSASLVSPITKIDLSLISKLLKDERIARRFEKYKVREEETVVNWHQEMSDTRFEEVRNELENLKENGKLRWTVSDAESFLRKSLGFELIMQTKSPNCYIQLISAGLGVYRGKETVFKEIQIKKRSNL